MAQFDSLLHSPALVGRYIRSRQPSRVLRAKHPSQHEDVQYSETKVKKRAANRFPEAIKPSASRHRPLVFDRSITFSDTSDRMLCS